MQSKPEPAQKEGLHPRNLHRNRYDFKLLCESCPELKAFVAKNKYNDETINFSDPQAVKVLNKALLKYFYHVDYWDIPQGYLCPPIPSRADYIHYMADLLSTNNNSVIPVGDKVKVLDIGVGANCVYPLIGNSVYGWRFVGSDTDPVAIRSAKNIISLNNHLKNAIELRLQTNNANIFNGIIKSGEVFDLTICNPPFHSSVQDARASTAAKWQNLGINREQKGLLNFGGTPSELWCPGGEGAFINRMIIESALIPKNSLWFSTLVSKKETLAGIYNHLKKVSASGIKTINMTQGQKISRIVAWTFLNYH